MKTEYLVKWFSLHKRVLDLSSSRGKDIFVHLKDVNVINITIKTMTMWCRVTDGKNTSSKRF
jgi:hypothetical protein